LRPVLARDEPIQISVDQIPEVAFVHRTDGQLIEINEVACERLGYAAEELVDTPLRRILACDLGALQMNRLLGRLLRRDGSSFPVEVSTLALDGERCDVRVSVARDVSSQRAAELQLDAERHFRELALKLSVGLLSSDGDVAHAALDALHELADLFDVDIAALTRVSKGDWHVEPLYTWARDERIAEQLRQLVIDATAPHLAGCLLREGSYAVDANEWPEAWHESRVVRDAEIQSSLYVMIEDAASSIVFVSVDTVGRRAVWPDHAVPRLQLVGKMLLDGIERRNARQMLRAALDGMTHAFSRATEARDPFTAGHQSNVSRLAVAIAEELDLPMDAREELRIAALLHDIGKLSIPMEILSKPGPLSVLERRLVEEHCTIGYEVLSAVSLPGDLAEIVHQHHERMDGSGYPRGLSGQSILKKAQILAVADVVEAMSSHRPYRPARERDAVMEELQSGRGRLYDAGVVDACLRVLARVEAK